MILAGGAVLLAMLPMWTPGLVAGPSASTPAGIPGHSLPESPLNRNCVVTVDPRAEAKREVVGLGNKISGFAAPDTAEGVLVHLDSEWLVLRDGSYESWIPRNKVLMLRVSR